MTAATDLSFAQMQAVQHPHRWRLSRAGIQNVWHYYGQEFTFSGGRCIWRGVNGAGKSRALEMLLPFLLDADRRKIDSTQQGRVRLEELMKAGGPGAGNRLGYLWLELVRTTGPGEQVHLTLGALVRFAHATAEAKVWYFTTPLRIGVDFQLMDAGRAPLARQDLTALIGADHITDSPGKHRDKVRAEVFGLSGEVGAQRFTGLMQLLHTLRAPDVGNRIDEGNLSRILSDALPPLSGDTLQAAGSKLDALKETREAQARLAASLEHVSTFLRVYSTYAAAKLTASGKDVMAAIGQHATARREHERRLSAHRDLDDEREASRKRVEKLDGDLERLVAAVDGIKASERYKSVEELADRERAAAQLGASLDSLWAQVGSTIRGHRSAVSRADEAVGTVTRDVERAHTALQRARAALQTAELTHQLPAQVQASVVEASGDSISVRTNHQQQEVNQELAAPRLVEVSIDREVIEAGVTAAGQAAASRRAAADLRARVGGDLDRRLALVEQLEAAAESANARAEQATQDAERDQRARDDIAIRFAVAWRDWVDSAPVHELLGEVRWQDSAAGPLLLDAEHLTGPSQAGDLAGLGEAAADGAEPAQARVADELAALTLARRAIQTSRTELRGEAARLEKLEDPPPPVGPGQYRDVEGAPPLWSVIDFRESVDERTRAGIEGALIGSGLLTASVHQDGTVRAGDGQVLVTPTEAAAAVSLGQVLTTSASDTRVAGVVTAVLESIGWGSQHPVSIAGDGSWRNGLLAGKHTTAEAQHIGAAARAAARKRRLAEIGALLAQLAEQDRIAQQDEHRWQRRRSDITALVRTAPSTDALLTARAAAVSTEAVLAREIDAAAKAADTAGKARGAWRTDADAHEHACTHAGLPTATGDLRRVRDDAGAAVDRCRELAGALTQIAETSAAHARLLDAVTEAAAAVKEAHAGAVEAHGQWAAVADTIAATAMYVGTDRQAVLDELATAEGELSATRAKIKTERDAHGHLIANTATARSDVGAAALELERKRTTLELTVSDLVTRANLPGVLAAAANSQTFHLPGPQDDPTTIDRLTRQLLADLPTGGNPVSDRQVDAAIEAMARQLTGTFDVDRDIVADTRTVTLQDITGVRHVAAAVDQLTTALAEGRAALNERERTVFTTFVLEGVAAELGARLKQALTLVSDMNTSMSQIRTQQGIGLSVAWDLPAEASPQVRELRELVSRAAEMRTSEQDARLIELVKGLVDVEADADPSAGYADHLQAALDYKAWHTMTVYILGPEKGRKRAISPRAKLSQGETRFVSYATLFAAVDAYLTGLPDTDLALRVVLLDDAFAKIDNQVVGQFLGLLVNLDLDFAMTGHGLWGTFPQVPALDVYEVRRGDGPAITTHVHWDGHTRHLRPVRA